MDLMKLMDEFGTEQACREVLAELRWPAGVTCPRCQAAKHAYDSNRWVWDCYSCGYQFSALSGTILHDTKLPLQKWFVAVFLICEARAGMSANQMKRTLGVSYKTGWYLCHRIRAAMGTAAYNYSGEIHDAVDHNVDESLPGDVHPNAVESPWSLLKHSLVGSDRQRSTKHLPAYLDEVEWWFNNRDNENLFRHTLTRLVSTETLPYAELTA